jgi:lysophospholipase L1-like esterase
MVGGNDLFEKKCTDRFVMANVLNVAKRIFEDQPEAKIVVHGITPRKDYPDSKSQELGHLWNRAQGINLKVRKFIKEHSSRIYYMNLGQVLTANRQLKGRTYLDASLIADGTNPTPKGMQKWGDLVKKKINPILHGFDMDKHRKQHKDDKKKENTEDAST